MSRISPDRLAAIMAKPGYRVDGQKIGIAPAPAVLTLAPEQSPPEGKQWLTLPYPPSANNYWRSIVIKGAVRVLLSSEARKYKAHVQGLAGRYELLTGPIGIVVRIYRPKRIGDLGNRIKVLEDALQGVLFGNDSQIERIEATRHEDKANPRAEVAVWALPHARPPVQGSLQLGGNGAVDL